MLIPHITDETRREAYVTASQEGDFPRDFWISEREHRKRLQALRDMRDQCELLGKCAVFADVGEVSV